MQIRQSTPEDEAAVCSLWKQLMEFYRKMVVQPILQRSFRYAVSHPEQVRIYVAVVEDVIAGTVSLHLGHYSTWNDNWYGHIEDVIVDPVYRRRGVAEALVRFAIAKAVELGLSRVELNTMSDNVTARKMYEKIGFKTDSVAYELSIKR